MNTRERKIERDRKKRERKKREKGRGEIKKRMRLMARQSE